MQSAQGIRDYIRVLWNRIEPFLVGRWVFISREEEVWLCSMAPFDFCKPVEKSKIIQYDFFVVIKHCTT